MIPTRRRDWQGVPVLVTTSRRIYAGLLDLRDYHPDTRHAYHLTGARNALRGGVTNGVAELATAGPGDTARLEVACNQLVVADVCVIRPLSPTAWKRWQTLPSVGER